MLGECRLPQICLGGVPQSLTCTATLPAHVCPTGWPRLRLLLAVARANRAPGGGAGSYQGGHWQVGPRWCYDGADEQAPERLRKRTQQGKWAAWCALHSACARAMYFCAEALLRNGPPCARPNVRRTGS